MKLSQVLLGEGIHGRQNVVCEETSFLDGVLGFKNPDRDLAQSFAGSKSLFRENVSKENNVGNSKGQQFLHEPQALLERLHLLWKVLRPGDGSWWCFFCGAPPKQSLRCGWRGHGFRSLTQV